MPETRSAKLQLLCLLSETGLLLLSAATICSINPSFTLQLLRHSYHDITTITLFFTRPLFYIVTKILAQRLH
jgi:hypothetical protein